MRINDHHGSVSHDDTRSLDTPPVTIEGCQACVGEDPGSGTAPSGIPLQFVLSEYGGRVALWHFGSDKRSQAYWL